MKERKKKRGKIWHMWYSTYRNYWLQEVPATGGGLKKSVEGISSKETQIGSGPGQVPGLS